MASETTIATSGTQIATRLGNTAPPKIDIAAIGAKLAGWGKIRKVTPIKIKQTAMAKG